MRRTFVRTCLAAVAMAILSNACTHASDNGAAPKGWRVVRYASVTFAVPRDWQIHHVDNSHESACLTPKKGVYLEPDAPPQGGFGCPLNPPGYVYPATVTVSRIRDASPISGEHPQVNGETAVIFGRGADGWQAVGFPDLRVWFEFYGSDPNTQAAVIHSVSRV